MYKNIKPEDQWSCIAHLRSSFILSDVNLWYVLKLFYYIYQLLYRGFLVIHHLSIFPYKRIRNHCVKRSTWWSSLKEFGSTWVPNVAYQVSRSLAVQFWRRFLKAFTIYWYGSHLGHVTSPVSIESPCLLKAQHAIWLQSNCFRAKAV